MEFSKASSELFCEYESVIYIISGGNYNEPFIMQNALSKRSKANELRINLATTLADIGELNYKRVIN